MNTVPEEIIQRLYRSAASKQWDAIKVKHHHGINTPLFSLKSSKSCGIGEFTDLILLIDWCHSVGMDVLQLLPINDTGTNYSPYSILSAYALNPFYLGIAALPNVEKYPQLQAIIAELQNSNSSPRVDYSKVFKLKYQFFKQYIDLEGEEILSKPEFLYFLSQSQWLPGYALYKTLRIKTNWNSWESWSENLKNPGEEMIRDLLVAYKQEVDYHMILQFLCFQQMENIKKYATFQGVFLKGDLPILIDRDSSDVWLNRSLFQLEYSAGSPPDMYNSLGQNWGFPVYNWDELAKFDNQWWKLRLRCAEKLYHIYRLDHLVGFFRFWAIEDDKPAIEGKFIPSDPNVWIAHGRRIMLMKLNETIMLPIGEDLGTVPPEVRNCLRELGICGTRVMRWERDWHGDRSYIKPENYWPESMTTVSTHDSELLQQWWKKHPDEAGEYAKTKGWDYSPFLALQQRKEILKESHRTASLFHINLLQEYLALMPGLSQDPEIERINVPGIDSDLNWRLRYIPSLEELLANEELKDLVRELLT